jgi:hypothetical protein
MSDLDLAYLRILHHGLCALRDSVTVGDLERSRVESEHLHNLPSLVGEANIHRHRYYADQERVRYLEWMFKADRKDVQHFADVFYSPFWHEIDRILESWPPNDVPWAFGDTAVGPIPGPPPNRQC